MVIRGCVSYTNTLIDSKFTEGCAQGQVAKRECRTDLNFFFKEETRQSWGGSCCCSVARLCLTFCDPLDCSIPDLPVLHYLLSFLKFMPIDLVMPSNHLILSCPLLLLPSIFPCIGVFFPKSQLFASGGPSIGALATVLPMNIQVDFVYY